MFTHLYTSCMYDLARSPPVKQLRSQSAGHVLQAQLFTMQLLLPFETCTTVFDPKIAWRRAFLTEFDPSYVILPHFPP